MSLIVRECWWDLKDFKSSLKTVLRPVMCVCGSYGVVVINTFLFCRKSTLTHPFGRVGHSDPEERINQSFSNFLSRDSRHPSHHHQ